MFRWALPLTLISVCVFAGCRANEGEALEFATYSQPERDLPIGETNLQKRIDQADGAVVEIPLGRYVLSSPLIIQNKSDLHIRFAPGTQLRCTDVNADVIRVLQCNRVVLSGFRARHVEPLEEYQCHGGVMDIVDSNGITLSDGELNGCGAIGIHARNCIGLRIKNCHIHNNSFNALYLDSCKGVELKGCLVEDNANFFQAYNCSELEFSDNLIRRNGGYWHKPMRPGISPDLAEKDRP